MSRSYRIAQMAGDGIGPEVVAEARKVVEAVAAKKGFNLSWGDYPFGAEHYLKTGEVLPESVLSELTSCQALLLGAIGDPRVKPGILERGILLKLRFFFDMYVNLRPAKAFPRVPLPVPLTEGKAMDLLVVRENTEDFYIGLGGDGDAPIDLRLERGLYTMEGEMKVRFSTAQRSAFQVGLATEGAVRRITADACQRAEARGEKRITLATKANAMPQLYGFWEEIARDETAQRGLAFETVNVDALCYHLVRTPWKWNVVLCPNMFGDIVSDLLAALSGGLGVAAGANIGDSLGMFEPVHGSAPDIAGQNRANPVAAILSAALMLDCLGEAEAARAVEKAVGTFLETAGPDELPEEMGGRGTTTAIGDAVASRV
ncbi:MAG: isocitrate/isopropylmalate dehydrogenase family protein [Synergistaceae bacterium]|nr:isocitrate/isopropylmalate dehydrogenase family protein [Synergistaceae bacterium]